MEMTCLSQYFGEHDKQDETQTNTMYPVKMKCSGITTGENRIRYTRKNMKYSFKYNCPVTA